MSSKRRYESGSRGEIHSTFDIGIENEKCSSLRKVSRQLGSAALIEHRSIESPQTSDKSPRRRSLLLNLSFEFEFIEHFFDLLEHGNLRRLKKKALI